MRKRFASTITLLTTSFLLLAASGCDESPDDMSGDLEERSFFSLEQVAAFNPAALEAPESVAADHDGNLFISMALTGEIRKIDENGVQSTHAVLPIGAPLQPCGGLVGILGALATDWDGNLYASVASCIEENRGIWKIEPDGTTTLMGNMPFSALPNGIARFAGHLYIADSSGAVWKMPLSGGDPEVWSDDPLLAQSGVTISGPFGDIPVPGPNGLQFYGNDLYIANSSQGTIVRIKVQQDGSPGTAEVYHTFEDPTVGCDDFAIDLLRRIYCTTDPAQLLIRVDPDGSEHVLWDETDGLDGPTAATFGRGDDSNTLYITNAQFPFFEPAGNGPSLLKVDRIIPGYPFR